MRPISIRLFLGALAVFLIGGPVSALAKTDTADPNITARKAMTPPEAPKGPPEVPGAKALADLEMAQKRNGEMAVQHYSQLIKTDPKDSSAYTNRGKAYSALKQYDKALTDLQKAIELDPKQTEAYKGRAVIRYLRKDYKGSWEDVHQVEALGGAMWPSFVDALKQSSGQKS